MFYTPYIHHLLAILTKDIAPKAVFFAGIIADIIYKSIKIYLFLQNNIHK